MIKKKRSDRFTMLKEIKSRDPFMKNFGKSAHFNPNPGVTHRDSAREQASPRVDGGKFKPSNASRISRKELEERQTLSLIHDIGPLELRSKVNQSVDVFAFQHSKDRIVQQSVCSSSFSTHRQPINRSDRIRLPALKSLGRPFNTRNMMMSRESIDKHN